MKLTFLRHALAALCAAALILSAAACDKAPAESTDSAASASGASVPTPDATSSSEPISDAGPESGNPESSVPESRAAESAPQEGGETENTEISVEVQTMYPLIEAHMLALLNGGAFDRDDPVYFWQTVAFAIDGCGLEFYSAETVGNALLLSRGVIEEIASGLFESGGDTLPEIPETLGGELQYDAESDAYAHPLGGGGYDIAVSGMTNHADGSLTLAASLTAGDTTVADFTVELVENTREGNSLFTYSIRSIQQT